MRFKGSMEMHVCIIRRSLMVVATENRKQRCKRARYGTKLPKWKMVSSHFEELWEFPPNLSYKCGRKKGASLPGCVGKWSHEMSGIGLLAT